MVPAVTVPVAGGQTAVVATIAVGMDGSSRTLLASQVQGAAVQQKTVTIQGTEVTQNVVVYADGTQVSQKSAGKTQTINFYNINDALYYVDLPGYGYAKVALEAKEKWGKMIERYLKNSSMLKMVFLLVDIRHEPSANDKMMYDWIIYNGYHPVIIATKLDKINRSQIQKHVKMIRQGLGMEKEGILIPFSAETKQGRDEIWDLIESNL